MKKVIRIIALVAIPAFMSSCIAIQSVSVSNPDSGSGSAVTGDASGMGFLMLTTPDAASLEKEALAAAKANGATKNMTARLQMRQWLLVQNYRVIVTGEK